MDYSSEQELQLRYKISKNFTFGQPFDAQRSLCVSYYAFLCNPGSSVQDVLHTIYFIPYNKCFSALVLLISIY